MGGAAALALAVATALLIHAWTDRTHRAWAWLTLAGLAGYVGLHSAPQLVPGAPFIGRNWNWSGYLLALTGTALLGAVLVRRLGLSVADLGLRRPIRLRAAILATVVALACSYAISKAAGGALNDVRAETWLFLATMPGLVEELAFRGVLLAAAERAAPAACLIAGAPVSVGALLLTLAFVGLHGISLGTLISVLPAALLYLWLRMSTGSILPPVVAHNLWNLAVLAAHL